MKNTVTVIGVAWAGSESDFRGFVDRHMLTFQNIADPAGDVYRRFTVPYQPAWVYMKTDGTWQVRRGSLSEEAVISDLNALTTD